MHKSPSFPRTRRSPGHASLFRRIFYRPSGRSVCAYWIIALWLLFTVAASRHASAESDSTVTMAPVVVSAHREADTRQTGDVDPAQSTSFSTVISREAFDGKMESLSNVIEKEAGIQVTQTGGLGSYSSASLRGSSSEQVMVYLDGFLLNEASGGGVDLSNISLSDVASVEVYKGTAPLNFGRGGIGGVVNIKTLRPEAGIQKSITLGCGSYNTTNFAGLINHKPGRFDYLVSADYSGSDNDFDYLNKNDTPEVPGDDVWEKRENAGVAQGNLLVKASYDLSPALRVNMMNQWFQKDQDLAERRNNPDAHIRLDTKRNITALNLTADHLAGGVLNTRVGLQYSWKEEDYLDVHGHLSRSPSHIIYTSQKYAMDGFGEWMTDWGGINGVVQAGREEFDADNKFTDDADDMNQSYRNSLVTGIQGNIILFRDRLVLTPGLTYTLFHDHREQSTESFVEKTYTVEKSYLTPQLGVKYALTAWLTLKANAARYIREPSFFELFGDRGYFVGNPDVEPEKGMNMDVGADIHHIFDSQSLLDDMLFSTAFFSSKTDDLIVVIYDSGGYARAENVADARIYGIESALQLGLLDHFTLTANATFQDTDNNSDDPAHNGRELPGRFKKSFLGKLEYRFKGLKLFTEYVLNQDMYYDMPNTNKAADKKEINAGVSFLYHDLLLTLEGRNLNDDLYEEFYMYPLPGRSWSVTAKYTF